MDGWYRPVRRDLHLDVRSKHLLDPALEINATTKAAYQKDKLDLLCSLLNLILDECENLADDRLEDLFDLVTFELKPESFDICPLPDSAYWDLISPLTVELNLRYPFEMVHGCV